jgi:hypothetical protein
MMQRITTKYMRFNLDERYARQPSGPSEGDCGVESKLDGRIPASNQGAAAGLFCHELVAALSGQEVGENDARLH